MVARLLGGELARVDQRLDVRVVVRDLRQLLATQHVRARVPDMHETDLAADEAQRRERGAHAVEFAVGRDGLGNALVGVLDRSPQLGQQVTYGTVLVEALQRGDGDLAGHLAGGVPAHAVGDGEQPGSGVHRVLVVPAHQPTIRAHRIPQSQSHVPRPPLADPRPRRSLRSGGSTAPHRAFGAGRVAAAELFARALIASSVDAIITAAP